MLTLHSPHPSEYLRLFSSWKHFVFIFVSSSYLSLLPCSHWLATKFPTLLSPEPASSIFTHLLSFHTLPTQNPRSSSSSSFHHRSCCNHAMFLLIKWHSKIFFQLYCLPKSQLFSCIYILSLLDLPSSLRRHFISAAVILRSCLPLIAHNSAP